MIHSKLPRTGTTIFSVMSKLAQENNAINLGQGFPGFPVDPKLIQLVNQHMQAGYNQYAPMPGILPLREKLAEKFQRLYDASYNPETEITITSGATQAIFTAITALVHAEDEVILFAPAYDCYAPAVELNGAKPVWVELHYPDYSIPWEQVKKWVNHRTRMIVINSPLNPGASALSSLDLDALQKIVSGTDIIVLSDEVYEHIVFDGKEHQSCARFPALKKQTVIVASFGKTFHATGWKMGYVVAPAELMQEFRKVHQYNVFSCNTPIQYAIAEYMEDANTYLSLPAFYQEKRDYFLHLIKDSAFTYKASSGSYFQLLNYAGISQKNDIEIAKEWTIQYGVASIPLSVFYPDHLDEKVLRFCFAKEMKELEQAAERINKIGK